MFQSRPLKRAALCHQVDDTRMEEDDPWEVSSLPFLHLSVELPATPLYADYAERNIIPQVWRRPVLLPAAPLLQPLPPVTFETSVVLPSGYSL